MIMVDTVIKDHGLHGRGARSNMELHERARCGDMTSFFACTGDLFLNIRDGIVVNDSGIGRDPW